MYTKEDLKENAKMDEILEENRLRMIKINKKREKKQKRDNLINYILCFFASGVFYLGLMYLLSVIEYIRN